MPPLARALTERGSSDLFIYTCSPIVSRSYQWDPPVRSSSCRVMSPQIRWNEPRVYVGSYNHFEFKQAKPCTQAAPAETRHGLITCTTYPCTSPRTANKLRLRS